ncbi:hypothetical protein [Halolamina sediminis]|uniref:hypothetical protein n=1 Tax=Halolamina sediminis TaxID=1480675 RepID=UPI0012AC2018|nr:hypothetical protein [Halolamina sediminis]
MPPPLGRWCRSSLRRCVLVSFAAGGRSSVSKRVVLYLLSFLLLAALVVGWLLHL